METPKKFLMFQEIELLNPEPEKKKKKNPSWKKLLIFEEIEIFNFYVKKFFIFSQKKAFLIFRETETLKIFFYFRRQLSELEK